MAFWDLLPYWYYIYIYVMYVYIYIYIGRAFRATGKHPEELVQGLLKLRGEVNKGQRAVQVYGEVKVYVWPGLLNSYFIFDPRLF